MFSSSKKLRDSPSPLEASAVGVEKVLSGPTYDQIDEQEAGSFLETQLRCELLRAQINSLKMSEDLKTRESKHRGFRINVVLACTIAVIVAGALSLRSVQRELLSAMIATLAIVSVSAGRVSENSDGRA